MACSSVPPPPPPEVFVVVFIAELFAIEDGLLWLLLLPASHAAKNRTIETIINIVFFITFEQRMFSIDFFCTKKLKKVILFMNHLK